MSGDITRRSWGTPAAMMTCTICSVQFLRSGHEIRRMIRLGLRPYCSVACSTKKGRPHRPKAPAPGVRRLSFAEAAAVCFARNAEPELNSGCLLWVSPVNAGGYGKATIQGQRISAHRAAWIAEHGPIDDPLLCVLHRCDTPSCVNSTHLFLGTIAENNADRSAKGRSYRGPRRAPA